LTKLEHRIDFTVFAHELAATPFIIFNKTAIAEGVELGKPLAQEYLNLATKDRAVARWSGRFVIVTPHHDASQISTVARITLFVESDALIAHDNPLDDDQRRMGYE
jgi:hypothetical protein